MIYLLAFVALVLASARLTRVLVIDEIATPLRNWVMATWPPPSKPSKLIRCYWCSGFWVSLSLVTTAFLHAAALNFLPWSAGWAVPTVALAVSYASAVLLDREGTDGV